METASTYYTRRARQERTSAVDAACAEARSAHLELALRLVRVATEPAMWSDWSLTPANDTHAADVGGALRDAFPVPAADPFKRLLDSVDRSDRD